MSNNSFYWRRNNLFFSYLHWLTLKKIVFQIIQITVALTFLYSLSILFLFFSAEMNILYLRCLYSLLTFRGNCSSLLCLTVMRNLGLFHLLHDFFISLKFLQWLKSLLLSFYLTLRLWFNKLFNSFLNFDSLILFHLS
jgi:hypothetical protein